jgi:mannosyltransferase
VRSTRWGDAALVGVIGFVLAVAFSWVPGIWYDESATIISATRSYSQLWAEIHRVDAVHAFYYGGMHAWFSLVGYSPFTLRLPSAIGVGVAAFFVTVLATRLTGRRAGVIAGLLFTILPRVTWLGNEGRSYALATAFAAVLTLAFVSAVDTRRRGSPGRHTGAWIVYGVLAFFSTLLFLYSALVVVAHALTLLVWALHARRAGRTVPWRDAFTGWVLASGAAGVLLVPLARLSIAQSKQVGWLPHVNGSNFGQFFTDQWFLGNPVFAVFGWALVVFGIVHVLLRARRPRVGRPDDQPHGQADAAALQSVSAGPGVLQVTLPWMLVPSLGLLAVSVLSHPLYTPRYLSYGAPAVAILMAVGLTSVRMRSLIAAGLVVCVGLSLPSYIGQRVPEAKESSAWGEVATLVAKERRLEGPSANDAIIYGPIRHHPKGSARNIAYAYPKAFAGLTDVTLKRPAAEIGALWESRYSLADSIERVRGHDYVWLITSTTSSLRGQATEELRSEGFHPDAHWHFTWLNVVRYRH